MSSLTAELTKARGLPLKWLFLAWVPLLPALVVMGVLGAVVQGDPEPFVKNVLGFGDIGIFSLGLYGLGLCLALYLLSLKLRSQRINWQALGLRGRITPLAGAYIIGALILDSVLLFPGAQWISGQASIPFFWDGSGSFKFASGLDLITAVAAAVIIAPIAEEIIFRGYLLRAFLDNGYHQLAAVLLSAIIFASVHVFFGPGFVLYIIVWAMIPTFLYLKFKSLYPAIAFHMLNNILAYAIVPLL